VGSASRAESGSFMSRKRCAEPGTASRRTAAPEASEETTCACLQISGQTPASSPPRGRPERCRSHRPAARA
jgi:hypothetical protein